MRSSGPCRVGNDEVDDDGAGIALASPYLTDGTITLIVFRISPARWCFCLCS